MNPTEKLRKRAIELSNELIGTNHAVSDLIEAALIETRNETLEEAAQSIENEKTHFDGNHWVYDATGTMANRIRSLIVPKGDV